MSIKCNKFNDVNKSNEGMVTFSVVALKSPALIITGRYSLFKSINMKFVV